MEQHSYLPYLVVGIAESLEKNHFHETNDSDWPGQHSTWGQLECRSVPRPFLLPRRGWFRDYESPSKLLTNTSTLLDSTVGSPAEGTCRVGGGLGTRCFGFLIYSDISAALRGLLFISCRSGLARQFVLCQARRPRLCSHRGWEEKCRQHRRGSCLLLSFHCICYCSTQR